MALSLRKRKTMQRSVSTANAANRYLSIAEGMAQRFASNNSCPILDKSLPGTENEETKMSDEKGYNGWSNYETWNVKLWMDNDEGSYNYWREQVREVWEDKDHDKDDTITTLAKMLEQEHDDNMPELNGCYADLLGAAMSEVDWYEIAEAMVNDEDLTEDEEETEDEKA